MKHFFFLLAVVFTLSSCASVARSAVPTPAMAVSWDMKFDSRQWKIIGSDGDSGHIAAIMAPPGETQDHWTMEIVQVVIFTKMSGKDVAGALGASVKESDPTISLKETDLANGDVIVVGESRAVNVYSVTKYLRGPDGVYVLTCKAHLDQLEPSFENYSQAVIRASLVKNPHSK